MDDFSGYEKMATSLQKMGLHTEDFSEMEKLQWVVTEKVHGANFSFVYEKEALKFAKRKAYLDWTDDFFGFQLVVNRLEGPVTRMFEALARNIPGSRHILYGELFGGQYPHSEVHPVKNIQAIQTGVYYAPSIEFCAFDIAIVPGNSDSKYYLDYQTTTGYLEEFGIFHAHPLHIGKFNEVIQFNTRINSTIPRLLGLPKLGENLIEGVVIKPWDQPKGSILSKRPVFKLKNPEFEEDEKFHEAQKWSYIPAVGTHSAELSFLIEELKKYLNPNRLASAVSKVGMLDPGNTERWEEIREECLQDIFTDFNENHGGLLNDLNTDQMDWVRDRIRAAIEKLMIEKTD